MECRLYYSDSFQPWFNIALEKWLLLTKGGNNRRILYLWRNQPSVIIGRYQNPWAECNLQVMENDRVILARRESGGGAVFHDTGNCNYSLILPSTNFADNIGSRLIVTALRQLGAESSLQVGRNDIVVDFNGEQRKVCGTAFKRLKDRTLHHGCILVDTDLRALSVYLRPDKRKLTKRGIDSVRSRVANLCQIIPQLDHCSLRTAVEQSFFDYFRCHCRPVLIRPRDMKYDAEFQKIYQIIAGEQWRLGSTPSFNHHLDNRFDWGRLELYLQVDNGRISAVTIYSDIINTELPQWLTAILTDVVYQGKAVAQKIFADLPELESLKPVAMEIGRWLQKEI